MAGGDYGRGLLLWTELRDGIVVWRMQLRRPWQTGHHASQDHTHAIKMRTELTLPNLPPLQPHAYIYSSPMPSGAICREYQGITLGWRSSLASSLLPFQSKVATRAICELMEGNKREGKHFFLSVASKLLACIPACSNLALA